MGEWSDYFEDFPEENPANYVGNRFDPQGAAALRAQEAKVARESAELRATVKRMAEEGRLRALEKQKQAAK